MTKRKTGNEWDGIKSTHKYSEFTGWMRMRMDNEHCVSSTAGGFERYMFKFGSGQCIIWLPFVNSIAKCMADKGNEGNKEQTLYDEKNETILHIIQLKIKYICNVTS